MLQNFIKILKKKKLLLCKKKVPKKEPKPDPAWTNLVSHFTFLELVPWQDHTVGASPLSHSIAWRPRIWERPVLNPGTQKSWGVLVQHLQSYSDLPRWSVLNRGQ
jgi:hypothetical protein